MQQQLTDNSEKINNDPDFISVPRYSFSLKKLLNRYPEKVPSHIAAQALNMTEEQIGAIYNDVVKTLRENCLDPK